MIELKPIEPSKVDKTWETIEAWVKDALADDKSYLPDDIKNMCINGEYQLWVIFNNSKPTGFLMTMPQFAAQGLTVYAPLLGGQDLESWVKEGLNQLKPWLQSIKALSFSWIGRAAWKKLVKVDSTQCLFTINMQGI